MHYPFCSNKLNDCHGSSIPPPPLRLPDDAAIATSAVPIALWRFLKQSRDDLFVINKPEHLFTWVLTNCRSGQSWRFDNVLHGAFHAAEDYQEEEETCLRACKVLSFANVIILSTYLRIAFALTCACMDSEAHRYRSRAARHIVNPHTCVVFIFPCRSTSVTRPRINALRWSAGLPSLGTRLP